MTAVLPDMVRTAAPLLNQIRACWVQVSHSAQAITGARRRTKPISVASVETTSPIRDRLAHAPRRGDVDHDAGKSFRPSGLVQDALPLGPDPDHSVISDDAIFVRVNSPGDGGLHNLSPPFGDIVGM